MHNPPHSGLNTYRIIRMITRENLPISISYVLGIIWPLRETFIWELKVDANVIYVRQDFRQRIIHIVQGVVLKNGLLRVAPSQLKGALVL